MKEYRVVGHSVRRFDALEKATGTAMFTTDFKLPGMLYAKVLRSPYPHAKIVNIDTREAEKLPGVKAVATFKNSPRKLFNTSATMTFTIPPLKPVLDQYIFDNVVRYVGDEVAAVAAESEKIAEAALKLIRVDYEQLPAIYDPLEAMQEGAPNIFECEAGKNIPGEIIKFGMGDIEQGFAESDVIIEETFKLPVQKQVQLETHAAVAEVRSDGKVTVWSTTQTPHPTKMILAHIFDIPESKIRVLNPPYIGGGFGVRIGCSGKAEPIAMLMSKLTKKPVKIVYTREEDFIASDTRHGGYVTVKLGAKNDGTFKVLDLKAILNGGAYCSFSTETPGVLGCMGLAVYHMPHNRYYGHSVYTNTTPAGAMRGFGNPQAMFPIESVVDMLAEKLNRDPMDLRLQNIMQVGDPWVLPYECSSSGLAECIAKGAKSIGWDKRGNLNNSDSKKLRGIGMGVGTHCSNAWPWCGDYSNAYVRVEQDGSIHMASGVPDMGTGTSTSLPQIAAEALGVKLDEISISFADTLSSPFEIGSHASRTCYAAGTAVLAAAQDVKSKLLAYAANALSLPPEQLDICDSIIIDKNNDGKPLISLKDIARKAHLQNKQFIGVGQIVPRNAPPWHAHFVEVEVDTETGQVKVLKVAAAHDVGKGINPLIVEGQIEGGVLMGVGYAVSEEIQYDSKGRQIHNNLNKYIVLTDADIPEIDTIIVESNDPTGPFGAKGVGECGMVPTAAAIANAVYNAIGIRFKEIPLTEERVLKALTNNKQ